MAMRQQVFIWAALALMLAIPLCLLYELGLLMGRAYRKRHPANETPDD